MFYSLKIVVFCSLKMVDVLQSGNFYYDLGHTCQMYCENSRFITVKEVNY